MLAYNMEGSDFSLTLVLTGMANHNRMPYIERDKPVLAKRATVVLWWSNNGIGYRTRKRQGYIGLNHIT